MQFLFLGGGFSLLVINELEQMGREKAEQLFGQTRGTSKNRREKNNININFGAGYSAGEPSAKNRFPRPQKFMLGPFSLGWQKQNIMPKMFMLFFGP